MEYRYTRHQVARGTRADAGTHNKLFLIKNVRVLRATYQIRLNAFRAASTGKKLILSVPASCKFHPSLTNLMKTVGCIRRESFEG